MNLLTLDFESYFDDNYSLRKMTIAEYVHDPRFLLHGLAIRYPDEQCVFERDVQSTLMALRQKYGDNLERITVLVHNGFFDLYVLAKVYNLRPKFFVDTLQLSHALFGRKGEGGQSGKLGDLAALLGLEAKGDISQFSGLRNLDGKQAIEMAIYAKHDVQLTYQIAERLLPQLSRPDVELQIMMHTIKLHHERGFTVDVTGIAGLIGEIEADAKQWFDKAGVTLEQASSRKDFNDLLGKALARTGRKLPMKNGKKGQIPATAKTDKEMQAFLEDDDEVVTALAQARLVRGSEAQQVAKLKVLGRIASATGGILPVHLVYHGAGTGRFAGGGNFNIQNLPKAGLGSKIRSLIQAPPGFKLVLVDLAQIECRVTAWLAGEKQMLDAFAGNADLYSREASAIFGREVRKPTKQDPEELARLLESMRQTGKQEVLGLGYGMGALKFMNTLLKDPKTARLFDGILLSPAKCSQIVARFREEFNRIPALWKEAEMAFRGVVMSGGRHWIKGVEVKQVEDRLDLTLPSKRVLRYPKIRLESNSGETRYLDMDGEEQVFSRKGDQLIYGHGINIYGGKIVENISQAIARDILVEAILRLESLGIPIVAHIHDEVIAVCRDDDAERTARIVVEELTRVPMWAPGLPLGADSKIAQTLAK